MLTLAYARLLVRTKHVYASASVTLGLLRIFAASHPRWPRRQFSMRVVLFVPTQTPQRFERNPPYAVIGKQDILRQAVSIDTDRTHFPAASCLKAVSIVGRDIRITRPGVHPPAFGEHRHFTAILRRKASPIVFRGAPSPQ